MKVLHIMLTNSDLIQQALGRPLKYFMLGGGLRQTCYMFGWVYGS